MGATELSWTVLTADETKVLPTTKVLRWMLVMDPRVRISTGDACKKRRKHVCGKEGPKLLKSAPRKSRNARSDRTSESSTWRNANAGPRQNARSENWRPSEMQRMQRPTARMYVRGWLVVSDYLGQIGNPRAMASS